MKLLVNYFWRHVSAVNSHLQAKWPEEGCLQYITVYKHDVDYQQCVETIS